MLIGDSSMVSPPLSLTAGTYNLQIWGNPNETSWQRPYDFIINYVPGVNNINVFSNNDALNLNVFPNPACNTIKVISNQCSVISIYNSLGEKIYSSPFTNLQSPQTSSPFTDYRSPITINISTLPSGVYLIKAITESGVGVSKFVKE